VLSGQAPGSEAAAAVIHLVCCRRCWDRAAQVAAELRREGTLDRTVPLCDAVLRLMEEEETQARSWLRAHGEWGKLRRLSAPRQVGRLKAEPALRTLEMFSVIAAEASSASRDDPHAGEATASVAYALAGLLPASCSTEPFRHDLQGEALKIAANCRRLAGDWRGTAAALGAARKDLQQGTGEPAREARLLSIEASLAADTGRLEQALELLARAAALHRGAHEKEAAASVIVQEASTFLAAARHEEAIAQAEEALRWLTPRETRLEMLARNIITESLVFLERPAEALRSFIATQPLFKQLWGRRIELQTGYLEALLLDALGHAREAEKTFRNNIAGRMDAELYKDAFLTLVTYLQSLVRRGAFDKAARACEEALAMIERAGSGCHSQMAELWRDLLTLINARRLTERQLLAARHYLVRHWNAPARHAPLDLAVMAPEPAPAVELFVSPEEPDTQETAPAPPNPVTDLSRGGYEEALEQFDRELIVAGLAHCAGRIRETARMLGISRNTLRAKIRKHGVTAGEAPPEPAEPGPLYDDGVLQALKGILARVWWRDLEPLPRGERLQRLMTVSAMQTVEMVEAMLEAASAAVSDDPHRGEETALLAHTLPGLLPRHRCPERLRNDLRSTALGVAADCRRSLGDWEGAAEALAEACGHLARGSGEPAREARLLEVQASLAADGGHFERALALLTRAALLYGRAQDTEAAAAVAVREADILLAAGRHQEAVDRAYEALDVLPPRCLRSILQAWNVLAESYVFLGSPSSALRCLSYGRPYYDQVRGPRTRLQFEGLVALVLDAQEGNAPQAERRFRLSLERRVEAGFHTGAAADTSSRGPVAEPGQPSAAEPAGPRGLEPQALCILPPDPVTSLAEEGYVKALERYDRQLVAAGLAQCNGRIHETCRLLGLSRSQLRSKLKRYLLTGREDEALPPLSPDRRSGDR
jgi:tetratricopeptide (TPR) repeat protein